jgi:hypothetical protein
MANPPKAKGTSFENEVVSALSDVWPDCHRSAANTESQDLMGTGDWVVECKHRKRWSLFDWIRRIRTRALRVAAVGGEFGKPHDWVIVAAHGDRRSAEGNQVGTVAIIDFERFVELLLEAGYGPVEVSNALHS